MTKRRVIPHRFAKPAGAVLIALAVLIGLSLLSHETAFTRFIATRLGLAFGLGVAALPALALIVGLVFVARQSFFAGSRLTGLLGGYAALLVALHLRYPAGRELLAASGRKGGGYAGALLSIALRNVLGEAGLWATVLLGLAVGAALAWGWSFEEICRAVLQAFAAAADLALRTWQRLLAWSTSAVLDGVRRLVVGIAGALRAAAVAASGAVARVAVQTARGVREGIDRARERARLHGDRPGGPLAGLGPLLAPAGSASTAVMPGAAPVVIAPPPPVTAPPPAGSAGAPGAADEDEADAADGLSLETAQPSHTEAGVTDETPPPNPAEARPGAGGSGVSPHVRSRRRRARVAQEALPFPDEANRAYALPDLSLLDAFPPAQARSGKVDPQEVARALEGTLASFGVDAKVIRWETGPVVTRYELQPAPGVKVQKITSLQNDIALALAASSVRLEAPIPGKSAIGVELPNERPGLVHLREILAADEFRASPSPLVVAVGKGIAGQPIVADLVAMPHMLIAGATGAGKSVAINAMIASILFRSTPEQARFLMIDPKRVELTNYNGIPHLLSPVVTGPREAAAKLRWAITEMESRFEMFAADGVRNIQAFNAQHPDRPLAYILIIIDELADLMMIAPADFEEIICRLAQMTRATGIHLLVATQRPSVDVITGLIKANIPSRVAFSVTSQVDSRTILDHPGAEKLLGRGDMLFAPVGATRPTRVQGAFISDAETERLVQFWRAQGEPAYVEALVRASADNAPDEGGGDDALLGDAARLVVRAGYASVSLLQRKMRIGYVRAARVVDQLEERGIVGPSQGSSPRDVLVGLDELERLLRGAAPASSAAASTEDAEA